MPDTSQLPHLLKLLDDDSETVRQSVAQALRAFGPYLKNELAQLPVPPNEAQIIQIHELIGKQKNTSESRFKPGQLVKHKRYGYRGIIVAVDLTCHATESWYQSNLSQPDRNQPWYHVLVHDSDQSPYAAQTSLEADTSTEEINHPWLEEFFSDFVGGEYIRNQRPWLT
ncbi:MAG: heat shock protein HspQ [Candidatus Latescibacteria bacterium]|nr:heat shock protein HspQ [Candidatus Latescibacterota bacterium]